MWSIFQCVEARVDRWLGDLRFFKNSFQSREQSTLSIYTFTWCSEQKGVITPPRWSLSPAIITEDTVDRKSWHWQLAIIKEVHFKVLDTEYTGVKVYNEPGRISFWILRDCFESRSLPICPIFGGKMVFCSAQVRFWGVSKAENMLLLSTTGHVFEAMLLKDKVRDTSSCFLLFIFRIIDHFEHVWHLCIDLRVFSFC